MKRKVSKFFGVADLNDVERMEFLDYWLTRAAKTHADDFLLNRCRKRPFSKRGTTAMTATQYRLSQASRDATDTQCVPVVVCFLFF